MQRTVRFQQTLAPLQALRIQDPRSFDGKVRSATVHWPSGCNALVDVSLHKGTTQLLPEDGYLALDNTTKEWGIDGPIASSEPLWVELRNADAVWPHTITVTVTIEEPER